MAVAMVAMVGMPSGYKLVISQAQGMYGIYCTEARGRSRPRVEVGHLITYIHNVHTRTCIVPVGTLNRHSVHDNVYVKR